MEQQPQNPGAPAQDSTMQASAVQGSHLPGNTAQSNAAQENTVQNNAAENTAVPAATTIQSPEHDPALADTASVAPAEAVAPAPAEPKRHGSVLAYLPPHGRIHGLLHRKHSLPLDVLRLLGIFLGSNDYSHYFVCCFAVRLLHLLCSYGAHR